MRKIRHNHAFAYHEAGHAAVAALLGILRNASVITVASAVKGEGGFVWLSKRPCKRWSARYKRKYILVLYAGPAVSKKLFPGVNLLEESGYYESDMVQAEHLMQFCAPGSWEWTGDLVFQSYKERMWSRAVAIVNANWQAICALAKELAKHKTLTGTMVKASLATHPTRPESVQTNRTATTTRTKRSHC